MNQEAGAASAQTGLCGDPWARPPHRPLPRPPCRTWGRTECAPNTDSEKVTVTPRRVCPG